MRSSVLNLLCFGTLTVADVTREFKSPARHFRPKFRYWLTDGSADPDQVAQDVKAIHEVGAGGLEFLAYYNYGQYIRADSKAKLLPGNYTKDGFGSPGFNDALLHGLREAVDGGMMFDIPLGGSMGQGVPSEYQSPGLHKELVRGSVQVKSGEQFSGSLPSPENTTQIFDAYINSLEGTWGGPGLDLKGVVVAQLTGDKKDLGDNNTEYTLLTRSLMDLTSHVDGENKLKWKAPSGGEHPWMLFAFYERFTDARNVLIPNLPEGSNTWFTNGSWVVDHFSTLGAKKTTDFFDDHVFNSDEMKDLLSRAQGLTWEDSMEFPSIFYYTPGIVEDFKKSRGYDLVPYLPIMHCAESAWSTAYESTYALDTTSEKSTDDVRQDYFLVLNEGYYAYLEHLNEWSNSYGLQQSSQPAYNLPLNMAKSSARVDVPELESLAFGGDPMNYKQMTGAAHISGKKIISTEVGAVEQGDYSLSVPRLKNLFQGSFAAGVNMMMIHGFPYGGEYENTTWPGFTTFHYHYTDMHGPRMPQWKYFDDTIMFIARNQLILQTGTPQLDLAVLYHEDRWTPTNIFNGSDLLKAGFSFEFMDPDNLLSSGVTVKDKILAPDGGAYRGLAIYNQTQISADASGKLLKLAEQGLPIFIIESIPNEPIGTKDREKVQANMKKLTKGRYSNVHVMAAKNFTPQALMKEGVQPRVKITEADDAVEHLYTFWQSDSDNAIDYVFISNQGPDDGPYSDFRITFETKSGATPYILDAWTGERSEIGLYNRTEDGHITMDFTLKSQVSTIVAFEQGGSKNKPVSSVSSNVASVSYDARGRLVADIENGEGATVSVVGSGKKQVSSGPSPPAAFNITGWDLSIDSWEPKSEPGNDSTTSATKIRKIDVGKLDSLKPWSEMDGLQEISGVGTYRVKFDWFPPKGHSDDMAVKISFGPVTNTLRAWLNGKKIAPVDIADAKADISKQIRHGSNEIVVEVSSTLFNAVKARAEGIHCLGESASDFDAFKDSDWQQHGLIGPVEVQTFRRVQVS